MPPPQTRPADRSSACGTRPSKTASRCRFQNWQLLMPPRVMQLVELPQATTPAHAQDWKLRRRSPDWADTSYEMFWSLRRTCAPRRSRARCHGRTRAAMQRPDGGDGSACRGCGGGNSLSKVHVVLMFHIGDVGLHGSCELVQGCRRGKSSRSKVADRPVRDRRPMVFCMVLRRMVIRVDAHTPSLCRRQASELGWAMTAAMQKSENVASCDASGSGRAGRIRPV